ncbi:hypothetical protein [Blastococcus sp. SYSU D00695]
MLRPIATPLPLGFLALVFATTAFAAVQLGWVPPAEGRVAALVVIAATAPLQLLASVVGFVARDPAGATGMGVLAGTWAIVGLATLSAPPGTASDGLGVVLLTAGVAMAVPAAAAAEKAVAAAVMGLAGLRFAVTGVYHLTASPDWQRAAGWTGLVLAVVALYAALALELEGARGRAVLPVGRRGTAAAATRGDGPLAPADLAAEPGVRPQL